MSLLFLDIFNLCSGLLLFLSSQECSRLELISVLVLMRTPPLVLMRSFPDSRSLYTASSGSRTKWPGRKDEPPFKETHGPPLGPPLGKTSPQFNMRLLKPEIGCIIKELLKFSQWISSVISHNGLDVIKLFKIKQKLQK